MELEELQEEIAKFKAKLKPIPPEMLKMVAPEVPVEAPVEVPIQAPPEVPTGLPIAGPIEVPVGPQMEPCVTKQFITLLGALPESYIGDAKTILESLLEGFKLCEGGK